MKTLVLILLLFSMSFVCYSQVDPQKMAYVKKSEKYRKMKNTGRVLTVLGGVLFVSGIVTLSKSSIIYNSNGTQSTIGNPGLGALEYLGGVAGLGAGIPLWIIGGHNQKKYDAKLQNLSVRFNATPQHKGLTLTYRF